MNNQKQFPGSLNLAFMEGVYAEYMKDPASVPADWQAYFQQLANGESGHAEGDTAVFNRSAEAFTPPSSMDRIANVVGTVEAVARTRQDVGSPGTELEFAL